MRDCGVDARKCAALAEKLLVGVLKKVLKAKTILTQPVDVIVAGYATAGARTAASVGAALHPLQGFKSAAEKLEPKITGAASAVGQGKVKSFNVQDVRVLHGWEEALLEVHAVGSVLHEDWKTVSMISFGGSAAQLAIPFQPEKARLSDKLTADRWLPAGKLEAAGVTPVRDIGTALTTPEEMLSIFDKVYDNPNYIGCGSSERHYRDYLTVLPDEETTGAGTTGSAQKEKPTSAHVLVSLWWDQMSFLASTNKNCAPQQQGGDQDHQPPANAEEEVAHDGPPCRARDLSKAGEARGKGFFHLAGGISGETHAFYLWAKKCLSKGQSMKDNEPLKKLLCACGFDGAQREECFGVDQEKDPAKTVTQCQAAMEAFFYWDDEAVFVAELLAEMRPTGSEKPFRPAGNLPVVALKSPMNDLMSGPGGCKKVGNWDPEEPQKSFTITTKPLAIAGPAIELQAREKCPEETKRKFDTGSVSKLQNDECVLALYNDNARGQEGPFRPHDENRRMGDAGSLLYRALLRVLNFGDGQPGTPGGCGPRGPKAAEQVVLATGTKTKTSGGGGRGTGTSSLLQVEEEVLEDRPPTNSRPRVAATMDSPTTVLNSSGDEKSKILSPILCHSIVDPRKKEQFHEMQWVFALSVPVLKLLAQEGRDVEKGLEEEDKLEEEKQKGRGGAAAGSGVVGGSGGAAPKAVDVGKNKTPVNEEAVRQKTITAQKSALMVISLASGIGGEGCRGTGSEWRLVFVPKAVDVGKNKTPVNEEAVRQRCIVLTCMTKRIIAITKHKADAHPPQPETVNVPVWVTTSPRYDGTGDGYESEHREKLISEETHDLSIHVQSPDFGETTVLTMAFLLAISNAQLEKAEDGSAPAGEADNKVKKEDQERKAEETTTNADSKKAKVPQASDQEEPKDDEGEPSSYQNNGSPPIDSEEKAAWSKTKSASASLLEDSPSTAGSPEELSQPTTRSAPSTDAATAPSTERDWQTKARVLQFLPAAKVGVQSCVRKEKNLYDIRLRSPLCPFQAETTDVACHEPGRGAIFPRLEDATSGKKTKEVSPSGESSSSSSSSTPSTVALRTKPYDGARWWWSWYDPFTTWSRHKPHALDIRQRFALQMLVKLPAKQPATAENEFRLTAISSGGAVEKGAGSPAEAQPQAGAEGISRSTSATTTDASHEVSVTIHEQGPMLAHRVPQLSLANQLRQAALKRQEIQCAYSEWVDGTCNTECGGGVRVRSRRQLLFGCEDVQPMYEFLPCNVYPCKSAGDSLVPYRGSTKDGITTPGGSWGSLTNPGVGLCKIFSPSANEQPLCSSACCGGALNFRDRMWGENCPDYFDFGVERRQPCVDSDEKPQILQRESEKKQTVDVLGAPKQENTAGNGGAAAAVGVVVQAEEAQAMKSGSSTAETSGTDSSAEDPQMMPPNEPINADATSTSPEMMEGTNQMSEQPAAAAQQEQERQQEPPPNSMDGYMEQQALQLHGYRPNCEYATTPDGEELWTPVGECSEFCGEGLQHYIRQASNKRFSADCEIKLQARADPGKDTGSAPKNADDDQKSGPCAETGQEPSALYIGMDIGSTGSRASPLLRCGAGEQLMTMDSTKFSVKLEMDAPEGFLMRDCGADKRKCAALAERLLGGVLEKVVDAGNILTQPVDVIVAGYATAGARTSAPTVAAGLHPLQGFIQAGSSLEKKMTDPAGRGQGKVKSFKLQDVRVLHGWEEAQLEVHAVGRILEEDWKTVSMISFGGSSAQMAIAFREGQGARLSDKLTADRWLPAEKLKAAGVAIQDVGSMLSSPQDVIAVFDKVYDKPNYIGCGASEKHYRDYLKVLPDEETTSTTKTNGPQNKAPSAHVLISFLGTTNESCAPQQSDGPPPSSRPVAGKQIAHDGPPCRARDLSKPEEVRGKGFFHLAGGFSAETHAFYLWAQKCLAKGNLKDDEPLKKLLCACGFDGAQREACFGVDQTKTPPFAPVTQCQAAMETFFYWDDEAVFVAELLAEMRPTGREQPFRPAGGLPRVALKYPIKDLQAREKCPEDETKQKFDSGSVSKLQHDVCVLALYDNAKHEGPFRPHEKFMGGAPALLYRALLRVLNFGDGRPGTPTGCGPRGPEDKGPQTTQQVVLVMKSSGSSRGSSSALQEVEDPASVDPPVPPVATMETTQTVELPPTVLNSGGDEKTKILSPGVCHAIVDPRQKDFHSWNNLKEKGYDEVEWTMALSVPMLNLLAEQGKEVAKGLAEEARLEAGTGGEGDAPEALDDADNPDQEVEQQEPPEPPPEELLRLPQQTPATSKRSLSLSNAASAGDRIVQTMSVTLTHPLVDVAKAGGGPNLGGVCRPARGSPWYEKNRNSALCNKKSQHYYFVTLGVHAPADVCSGSFPTTTWSWSVHKHVGFDLRELACQEDPGFWVYRLSSDVVQYGMRLRAHTLVPKPRLVVDPAAGAKDGSADGAGNQILDSYVEAGSTVRAEAPYCRFYLDGACQKEPSYAGTELPRMDLALGLMQYKAKARRQKAAVARAGNKGREDVDAAALEMLELLQRSALEMEDARSKGELEREPPEVEGDAGEGEEMDGDSLLKANL
eukprot:g15658.t1